MPQIAPAQQPPVRCALPHLKRIAADEQAIAQDELNGYIAEQAEAVAPEELRVVDISFYDKEYYAGDKLIATVTHDDDDFVTQRWVVVINNAEVFRAATPMICHRFICIHYKDGSLPKQEQDATETPCTTGNEIMSQIFHTCEQHGLELLDDGIYQDDEKLGEVGFTDGHWWVIRASSGQQKVACGSVDEAVRMLLVVEAVAYEELLDKAFDELTADEWLLVMESEPVRELVAA
ncbi:hypothetical protein [Nostoc sp. FACHB-145]|uniref:hypothetical protein n=1 Tax=Nostoc sp. FACHB-145 TaxID=2692836 RepID=UPI00168562C5|nr:hypothetical protein [Nostoc sp. FACHB-145]MBD2472000.1 hypothetical protein [Nostoc sp. FACHB-145]